MQTVAVPIRDKRTEVPSIGRSDRPGVLWVTEKDVILREDYLPSAHRIGLITSLIHVIIFFLPQFT